MLPSIAIKCLFRKFGRRPDDIKCLHTLYLGNRRVLQQKFSFADKTFLRYVNTSIHVYDKSNAKDAKDYKENTSVKDEHKIIKQSATGDIIVKTETDVDKVVTKVTIEKSQEATSTPKQPTPAPGML